MLKVIELIWRDEVTHEDFTIAFYVSEVEKNVLIYIRYIITLSWSSKKCKISFHVDYM